MRRVCRTQVYLSSKILDHQDRVIWLLKILFKIALFLYVHMNRQVVMKVVFQLVLVAPILCLLVLLKIQESSCNQK